ncbi:MAG: DUF4383 domain-containing protein [Micromonosporaceae bacterium]
MATHSSSAGIFAGRSVNPMVGGALGAVFVLVGLLGFLVSGGYPVVGQEGGLLLGIFEVNLAHNLVHLAVGAALIGGAIAGLRASRAVNITIGAVYLVVGLVGLLITGGSLDLLALNLADNGLHIVSGLALLAIGLGTDKS